MRSHELSREEFLAPQTMRISQGSGTNRDFILAGVSPGMNMRWEGELRKGSGSKPARSKPKLHWKSRFPSSLSYTSSTKLQLPIPKPPVLVSTLQSHTSPEPLGTGVPSRCPSFQGLQKRSGSPQSSAAADRLWSLPSILCWLLFALTSPEWFLIIDASFSFYLVLAAARKSSAFLH